MFIKKNCALQIKQSKKNSNSTLNFVENLKQQHKYNSSQPNPLIRSTDNGKTI